MYIINYTDIHILFIYDYNHMLFGKQSYTNVVQEIFALRLLAYCHYLFYSKSH